MKFPELSLWQTAQALQEDDSDLQLTSVLVDAELVMVKKLSRNDRYWADSPKTHHQSGPYIPQVVQSSGLFPPLAQRPDTPHIYECLLDTRWPQFGERHESRLVHYSNKGKEVHLTRVPRAAFRNLAPGSFLVIARKSDPQHGVFWDCITIDVATDAADALQAEFEFGPDFREGVYEPRILERQKKDRLELLVDEIVAAWRSGTISALRGTHGFFPSPLELAAEAQQEWMALTGRASLSPWDLDAPGDVLRQLTGEIEYRIFLEHQHRVSAVQVADLLVAGESNTSAETLLRRAVLRTPEIDALMLSASQRRKARAGTSFELHIARMLRDGRVPAEAQRVVGSRRPDFVLPTVKLFRSTARNRGDAMVLSAKTTLRERWKQVVREGLEGELFLATRDEGVSSSSIDEMNEAGIVLVVPESLKDSEITEYAKKENVITFRTFFMSEIKEKRMPIWS